MSLRCVLEAEFELDLEGNQVIYLGQAWAGLVGITVVAPQNLSTLHFYSYFIYIHHLHKHWVWTSKKIGNLAEKGHKTIFQ